MAQIARWFVASCTLEKRSLPTLITLLSSRVESAVSTSRQQISSEFWKTLSAFLVPAWISRPKMSSRDLSVRRASWTSSSLMLITTLSSWWDGGTQTRCSGTGMFSWNSSWEIYQIEWSWLEAISSTPTMKCPALYHYTNPSFYPAAPSSPPRFPLAHGDSVPKFGTARGAWAPCGWTWRHTAARPTYGVVGLWIMK